MPVLVTSLLLAAATPPVVVVDRDNIEITESCRIRVSVSPIVDGDGNGVIHITGDDITVTFDGPPLRGAAAGRMPDSFDGIGIRITGERVTVTDAVISGYKVGVYARRANGLVIEDCDVSDNFRQRLGSTARREDPADWLRPHANDDNQWFDNYGAGVYLRQCAAATVRRVRARGTQNGIVLDRTSETRIYDNDCSFGSGWGLALWRSSHNVISRNAFDFRVRGYSHGVYNRGQDSAGILLFEQCSDNVITGNSATHCGDGLFAFAGNEALGRDDIDRPLAWYRKRGNNGNVIAGNDFSWAAAHGAEVTFSFDNRVVTNRFVGNAICGFWGGYSHGTFVAANHFEANGDMPYGLERGGINIEHGFANIIYRNEFLNNTVGIHLWWDNDEQLMALPWARANPTAAENNSIIENTFRGDAVAVQLRQVGASTLRGNRMLDVGVEIEADDRSTAMLRLLDTSDLGQLPIDDPVPLGDASPVGAREHLAGREHILMTEWGPYDWTRPLLHLVERAPDRHEYELLGPEPVANAELDAVPGVILHRDGSRFVVSSGTTGTASPYELTVTAGDSTVSRRDMLLTPAWNVQFFSSKLDPREDPRAWRQHATAGGIVRTLPALDLHFGNGGPDGLDATDHFGTIATTSLEFPAGRWRITTTSDDGIRVWLGEQLVIDDWTWHPPKRHVHEFSLTDTTVLHIRVEHFELDGWAVLSVDIEPGSN